VIVHHKGGLQMAKQDATNGSNAVATVLEILAKNLLAGLYCLPKNRPSESGAIVASPESPPDASPTHCCMVSTTMIGVCHGGHRNTPY
jgi:hypothetical protein